jgi:hypothetical protein
MGIPSSGSTLKTEAAGSSKTFINIYQTTRHHIAEKSILQAEL